MDLIERFRYLMKLNRLNASSFADEIGVQASSVSHILSGRNKPSLEFIQKVLIRFPKIDANWLINGTTKAPADKDALFEQQEIQASEASNKNPDPEPLEESLPIESKSNEHNSKNQRVKKIIVFYEDATFEEFLPH